MFFFCEFFNVKHNVHTLLLQEGKIHGIITVWTEQYQMTKCISNSVQCSNKWLGSLALTSTTHTAYLLDAGRSHLQFLVFLVIDSDISKILQFPAASPLHFNQYLLLGVLQDLWLSCKVPGRKLFPLPRKPFFFYYSCSSL